MGERIGPRIGARAVPRTGAFTGARTGRRTGTDLGAGLGPLLSLSLSLSCLFGDRTGRPAGIRTGERSGLEGELGGRGRSLLSLLLLSLSSLLKRRELEPNSLLEAFFSSVAARLFERAPKKSQSRASFAVCSLQICEMKSGPG
jgi:hypothetical protein